MGISCNPATFIEGGGFLDSVDALVKKARFVMTDYNAAIPKPVPIYQLTLQIDDGDEFTQGWSVGAADVYFPSADGTELNGTKALNKGSNAGLLFNSMMTAGVPLNIMENPTVALEGAVLHFERVEAPARPGIKPKEGQKGDGKIPVVTAVVSLPGEAKAVAAAASADAAQGKAAAAILQFVNTEKGGKFPKSQLPTLIFANYGQDPDRNAILELCMKDEFLKSDLWNYKDGVISAKK